MLANEQEVRRYRTTYERGQISSQGESDKGRPSHIKSMSANTHFVSQLTDRTY